MKLTKTDKRVRKNRVVILKIELRELEAKIIPMPATAPRGSGKTNAMLDVLIYQQLVREWITAKKLKIERMSK